MPSQTYDRYNNPLTSLTTKELHLSDNQGSPISPDSPTMTHSTIYYNNPPIYTKQEDRVIQNFSPTGRPLNLTKDKSGKKVALNSMGFADGMGAGDGAFNRNPVRYTDESTFNIPVLPVPWTPSSFVSTESNNPIIQPDKSSANESSWRSRLSSLSGSTDNTSSTSKDKKKKKDKIDFIMKKVTKAEYMQFYAKDDNGHFIGTADRPADDCILRDQADLRRFRGDGGSVAGSGWRNEI